ncbi:MAG TPA: DNA-processing protein DprA [Pyrinomonadaceae bacterium]|nr:DNA-processing protein DprA [Pyrinomonadaceae bacterium]
MRDYVALNMTIGIGPRAAAKLLERFGSAGAVYAATRAELDQLRILPESIDSIIARDLHHKAELEILRVRKLGDDILVLDDGVYPPLLREIYDPPIVLYVKGAWSQCLDQPCVAIVGSRRCSTYGQNAALMLARDLAQRGVTIVSGFARGIDAAAHRGALEAGGRTIAVLGTGVDECYPRDHRKLGQEILESGGAMVSQFPLGTPPVSENFPYRNRIISGLSLGVVVVEAAENSGSLITARLAIEQNREVWAVPGNITSRNSFGTNYLIKGAGAKLVQQWQDIATELPPQIAASLLPPPFGEQKRRTLADQLTLMPGNLSGSERTVLKLLSPDSPAHIDALLDKTRLSMPDLTAALLALEMNELIRQLPGRCFVRKL